MLSLSYIHRLCPEEKEEKKKWYVLRTVMYRTLKRAHCRGAGYGCGVCGAAEEQRGFSAGIRPERSRSSETGRENTIKGGTGSGDVNVRHFVSVEKDWRTPALRLPVRHGWTPTLPCWQRRRQKFLQGLKAEAKAAGVNAIWYCMGKVMAEPAYNIPLEGEAETAVYVPGEKFRRGS